MLRVTVNLGTVVAIASAQGRVPNLALRAAPAAYGLDDAPPFTGTLPAAWSIRNVSGLD